ncbi:MAG: sugar transferase [Candidatus Kapabacteria bacterium]|nr:sugar transferase [Candidatus Kapabacteria bacterium]
MRVVDAVGNGVADGWTRVVSWLLDPRRMQLVVDAMVAMSSFIGYQAIRESVIPGYVRFPIEQELLVATLSALYWTVLLWFGGLYRDYYVRSPFDEIFTIIKQTFVGTAVLFFVVVMSSNDYHRENPRFVILVYWCGLTAALIVGRLVARLIQRSLRTRGIVRMPTLLYGTATNVRSLLEDLRRHPTWGYDVQGVVLRDPERWADTERPVLGIADNLAGVLRTFKPRQVLIAMAMPDHQSLLAVSSTCADHGCTVKIVPDLYEIFSGQARTQQIYGSPLIEVSPRLMRPWEEVAKRLVDVVFSLLVLILGAPVWALVALVVKWTSAGPVFYRQQRVGLDGRVFSMVKYRSMYVDDNRPPSWTSANDPRVTPIGRFIRKTHIDEVPQFWNVLKGEMSLVGPRPEQPYYVEKFSQDFPYYRRRLRVRPGITGWWQVKYKVDTESFDAIEERLRYDFFYIENMSFRLDIEILVRTVFVMIKGHGQA